MIRLPDLSTLRPRERLLATASAAVVMLVALDRLVLNPWARHARMVREEITQLEAEMRRHDRLLVRREEILGELEAYRRYLGPAIEQELQMASLLQEVEALAGASGVTLDEIKPLGTQEEGQVTRFTLDVRFRARTEAWVDFIHRLETSPMLFTILQAGLSVPEESPDTLQGYCRVVSSSTKTDSGEGGDSAGTPGEAG